MPPLTEDEFRLLAYMRGYVDHRGQSLDPNWVREQLEFDESRMRAAAKGLAARDLVEFFEFKPSPLDLFLEPELANEQLMCNIRLTERGWNYLRREEI